MRATKIRFCSAIGPTPEFHNVLPQGKMRLPMLQLILFASLVSGCASQPAGLAKAACGPLTPEEVASYPPGTFRTGCQLQVPASYNASSAVSSAPDRPLVLARSVPKDYKMAAIPMLQRAVADEMRDPESARFRSVTVIVDANGADALCGQINAKNAYGGYVGFEWFYAPVIELGKSPKSVVWLESKVGLDTVMAKCRPNG